jgi:5-methylcytosine-specific restriction endonuclease McrBC GTP-binding regulatory subunit McrB
VTVPTVGGQYGDATEVAIASVIDTCQRYGSSSIIALAGVPGTGKSFIGQIAAQRVAGDPLRVREIQFHPSMTYEEFVEGLRIDSSGAITVSPGLFLEWNDYALDNPDLTWVLLIDELSRANVSTVLGELMTFVEDRTRPFTTTYSRRPVKVATNLTVITTYNPTDRSALEIDNALLRRLRVLQFPPDTGQLREMLSGRSISQPVVDALVELFNETRRRHARDFDFLMPFGHGIFAEVQAEAPDLAALWEQRLRHFLHRPLVQPHPFADTIEGLYPWREPSYRTS